MANTGILVNGSRPNTYSNFSNLGNAITPTNRNSDDAGSKVISLLHHAYQSPNLNQGNLVSLVDLGRKLLEACRDGETEEVRKLICKGALFITDWLGTSALHLAAQNGHTSTCEKLLIFGISKDAKTKVDKTPLHIAAQEDQAEVVELLLKFKCNIDAQDLLGMTPLHWATEKCNVVSVETLLRFGANTTIQNKFGKTPLELASDQNRPNIYKMLQNPEVYSRDEEWRHALQQDEASTLAANNGIMSSNNLEFLDSIHKVTEESEDGAKVASFREKAIRELERLFQPETDPTIMVTAPLTVTTTATPTAVGSNSQPLASFREKAIRELERLFQPETDPTIMVTAPLTVTTTATPTAVGSNSQPCGVSMQEKEEDTKVKCVKQQLEDEIIAKIQYHEESIKRHQEAIDKYMKNRAELKKLFK